MSGYRHSANLLEEAGRMLSVGINGPPLGRSRMEEFRKWKWGGSVLGEVAGNTEKQWLWPCWQWSPDLQSNSLQFPLLLEVRHVNTVSPRVFYCSEHLFDLTRHQDTDIFHLSLPQGMIFHTTDADHTFQSQMRRKDQWVGPQGALHLRGQRRNSRKKMLPVILLFINIQDNLPSSPTKHVWNWTFVERG